jgi:hypothetical protein
VDTWRASEELCKTKAQIDALWREVNDLEPVSRNANAFALLDTIAVASSAFVPVEQLHLEKV